MFVAYVAMLVFGLAAVVAAFLRGPTATSVGEAVAAVALAGMTVGIFVAFFVQRPLLRWSGMRSSCHGSRSC